MSRRPPGSGPGSCLPGQLKRLGGAAREEYDEARHDWHANFGILRTPQLAAVHDELELIVAAGRCDPGPGARRGGDRRAARAGQDDRRRTASPAGSTATRSAATGR